MNSCLYDVRIMHHRKTPREHKFTHRIFMFYLDLDEIGQLAEDLRLIAHNKKGIYSFFDRDHMEIGGGDAKENILLFLKENGISSVGKIMLLTNLRTFGHIFNPVSFYFCFNKNGDPLCVVPEIGNTFGELKPFFIGPEDLHNGQFTTQREKYYYISPFIGVDVPLDFQLKVPKENLDIRIDDIGADGKKFLLASMMGEKKELNKVNLWKYTLCFPFVTLKVISLIHLHALILWAKGVKYHRKQDNMHMQKGVLRAWNKD